jgi:cell division protein FtsQ
MKTNPRPGSAAREGILTAPMESYGPETAWIGREPAPAGALLPRGLAGGAAGEAGEAGSYGDDFQDKPYRPRRGSALHRFRRWPKSVAGRAVAATVVLALMGAAAVGAAEARRFFLHDARFAVASSDAIEVQGNRHLTRAQVLSVFGADLERNIFRVNLAERRADLERLPWVSHATVTRLLPDHLRVQITERTPIAFVRQGTQIGLVDASGVLLDMPPSDAGEPSYSFPVLTGLTAGEPPAARKQRMDVYRAFIRDLDSEGGKLTETLSEVDVTDPEDVKALVFSGPVGVGGSTDVLVHFGDDRFLARYKEFAAHLPEWKQQYPRLASADMRYEGQIVLQMQTTPAGSAHVPAPDAQTATATPAPVSNKVADVPVDVAKASPQAASTAPVTAKPVEPKAAATQPAAVKKDVAAHPAKPAANASGVSASNQKMFAALAAARQKSLAQASAGKPGGGGVQ